MIIEDRTDIERGVVAGDGDLFFPPACVVCGSALSDPKTVSVSRGSVVGGSIESITFNVPLCETHAAEYMTRMRWLQIMMFAGLLTAVASFVYMELADVPYRMSDPRLFVPSLLGMTGAFVAIGAFKAKAWLQPVDVKIKLKSVLKGEQGGTWVRLRFADEERARSFRDANLDRECAGARPEGE